MTETIRSETHGCEGLRARSTGPIRSPAAKAPRRPKAQAGPGGPTPTFTLVQILT